MTELIQRPAYLEHALMFRDIDLVKVVTGIRRCGKSSLLQLVREHIEGEDVPGRSFASLNLEDRESGVRTDGDLYDWCSYPPDYDGIRIVRALDFFLGAV